jgi:hypothetical protein
MQYIKISPWKQEVFLDLLGFIFFQFLSSFCSLLFALSNVPLAGLEPAAKGLGNLCSIHY